VCLNEMTLSTVWTFCDGTAEMHDGKMNGETSCDDRAARGCGCVTTPAAVRPLEGELSALGSPSCAPCLSQLGSEAWLLI